MQIGLVSLITMTALAYRADGGVLLLDGQLSDHTKAPIFHASITVRKCGSPQVLGAARTGFSREFRFTLKSPPECIDLRVEAAGFEPFARRLRAADRGTDRHLSIPIQMKKKNVFAI